MVKKGTLEKNLHFKRKKIFPAQKMKRSEKNWAQFISSSKFHFLRHPSVPTLPSGGKKSLGIIPRITVQFIIERQNNKHSGQLLVLTWNLTSRSHSLSHSLSKTLAQLSFSPCPSFSPALTHLTHSTKSLTLQKNRTNLPTEIFSSYSRKENFQWVSVPVFALKNSLTAMSEYKCNVSAFKSFAERCWKRFYEQWSRRK